VSSIALLKLFCHCRPSVSSLVSFLIYKLVTSMTNAQSVLNDRKSYMTYEKEDMVACLLKFCMSTSPSVTGATILDEYRKDTEVHVKQATFFRKFAQEVDVDGKKQSLKKIRAKVLETLKKEKYPEQTVEYRECTIAAKTVIQIIFEQKLANQSAQRKALHQGNCILTANEEQYLVELCKILCYGGGGLDMDQILECMNLIAPPVGKTTHSETAARNFLARHPSIKLSGSSGVDPARAAQANDNVRETYFCKLDAYINTLYNMGKIKWKSFAEIPAKFKYNMDELGSDTTKRRKKVAKDSSVEVRCFTITPEGDKMPFHVTVCLTTRADGLHVCMLDGIYEGAPPPVIIHSKKPPKDPDAVVQPENVPDQLLKGLAPMGNEGKYKDATDAYKNNNGLGFLALATPNGSMKQCSMLPYAVHFVNSLPKDRDPQEGIILLLDGHSSRWDLPALLHLLRNNVYPFFYPSHTSIWSQANDCGPNMRLHNCISEAAKAKRGSLRNKKYKPSDWNVVFRTAWHNFLEKERSDYRVSKSNTAIFACQKTGIEPFNPRSSSWMDAIAFLGSSSNEQNKKFHRSYEIRVLEENSLSESEREAMLNGCAPIDAVVTDKEKTVRRAMQLGK